MVSAAVAIVAESPEGAEEGQDETKAAAKTEATATALETDAPGDAAATAVPTPEQTAEAAQPSATGGTHDASAAHTAARDDDSVWQSPWLWAGAGAVVVTGVVIAVLVASAGGDETAAPIDGSLPPGRITVPQ